MDGAAAAVTHGISRIVVTTAAVIPAADAQARRMHVVLIEDDEKIGSFVSEGMRQEGHVVSCARTGDDGLELARRPGIDVAIVDVMLPGKDGLAITRALRAEHVAIR